MASALSNILASINKKSSSMSKDDVELDYVPYIINRGMSYFSDTVMFANEMNMHPETPKYLQYLFYFTGIRKKSRFSKWHKKTKVDDIDIIKEYYGYSDTKAMEALQLLSSDDIDVMRERLFKGGT